MNTETYTENEINKLLNLTKQGLITEWNERIAIVAFDAGLPVSQINWQGSPAIIAQRVISFSINYQGKPRDNILKLLNNIDN